MFSKKCKLHLENVGETRWQHLNFVDSTVLLEPTDTYPYSENIGDCNVVKYAPCHIYPILIYEDDILTGSKIEFGPIMPGNYTATIDIDGDDFSESSLEFTVDSNEQSDFVLPSPIPVTTDITFNLMKSENGGHLIE